MSGLNAVSTGLRDVRFGRRRVVVLAPEQAVYSVRYVVVDRIDHVRATAGHGGDGPTHDSHHGALTDSQEQEHCCRPVSGVMQSASRSSASRSNCFHASQSERGMRAVPVGVAKTQAPSSAVQCTQLPMSGHVPCRHSHSPGAGDFRLRDQASRG